LLELVSRTGANLRQKLAIGESHARAKFECARLPTLDPEAARLLRRVVLEKLRVFEALLRAISLQQAVAADPKARAGALCSVGPPVLARV